MSMAELGFRGRVALRRELSLDEHMKRRGEYARFREQVERLFREEADCFDCTCSRLSGLGPCKSHKGKRKALAGVRSPEERDR